MLPQLFNHKLLITVVAVLSVITAQAQQSMRLDDCIAYALTNHPDIKVAQLQIQDAEARIKENLSTGLPQLKADLSYSGFIQRGGIPSGALSFGASSDEPIQIPQVVTDNFTSAQIQGLGAFLGAAFASDPDSKIYFSPVHSVSANVSASQLLFSNSYLVAKKATRFYRDFVNDQANVTRSTLRNKVTDAYLPALLISDNLTMIDKNIANLEKLLTDTRAINKAGFAEQLDVDRLDLSINTLRSERDNLARQREIVVNALKLTMGMSVGEDITLSDNLDALMAKYADADLTTQINLMKRAEYVNLLKARDLQALQLELYEKPLLPTVAGFVQWQGGLQGGFGAKDGDNFNKWYFIPSTVGGISVSTTLWDSGGNKARKQRAQIAVQTIEEQKKTVENAFQLELDAARKQYLNAQARVANAQKNLDLAQRIYDTTQKKYKAGIGSSFEVTQAEQGLYSAQQSLLTARFDVLTARVAIKKALGDN